VRLKWEVGRGFIDCVCSRGTNLPHSWAEATSGRIYFLTIVKVIDQR
jgi:hypothetical protein